MTAPARAPLDRAHLVRLLALLASERDAEALAAGRHAHEVVRAAGATWAELLEPKVVRFPSRPPSAPPRPWLRVHRIIAAASLCPARLSPSEQAFVRGLVERPPRQLGAYELTVLEQIGDKVGVH